LSRRARGFVRQRAQDPSGETAASEQRQSVKAAGDIPDSQLLMLTDWVVYPRKASVR
jgi:hypothetical protein